MSDDLIERWGFKWKGHDHGTHERMADGYWTPWHIAAARIIELEAELERRTLDGVHTCSDVCQRPACVLRRRVAELEAENAALVARVEGWRDIASAPRDGTVVLLYKPDERMVGPYMLAGYWGEWPGKGECWIASDGNPQGYYSETVGKQQGHPTHWQPLPAAPQALKDHDNG